MKEEVSIIDSCPVRMQGLSHALSSIESLHVYQNTESIKGLIRYPDILIVDSGFGHTAIRELCQAPSKPRCAIVVMTMKLSPLTAKFIKNGASALGLWTSPTAEIVQGIVNVSIGKPWTAPPINEPHRESYRKVSLLTPREQQIYELISAGYKNKDIGNALSIEVGTVKIHVKHIFKKTGISNRYTIMLSRH